MGRTQHRRRRLLGLVATLITVGLVFPPTATAEEGESESRYDWAPIEPVGGELPDELFPELADCPHPDDIEGEAAYCVKFHIYDGELTLGGTTTQVDPMEMTIAISFVDGVPVVFEPPGDGDGGGPASVKAMGGGELIGLPALDPLLDPLLAVSATPSIGEVGVEGDGAAFLFWLGGSDTEVALQVPLSVRITNLLLGDQCQIDEFEINLTNGTTGPPEGVEPISGSSGPSWGAAWYRDGYPPENIFLPGPRLRADIREGSRLVDNAFEVPGAADCGPLGLGKLLNDAGLGDLNVFDATINNVAGLPGPSGTNSAGFSVDTLLVSYQQTLGLGAENAFYWEDPRVGG